MKTEDKMNGEYQKYMLDIGKALYWPESQSQKLIADLPIYKSNNNFKPEWAYVKLPSWAADLEANEQGILIHTALSKAGKKTNWKDVDWWAVAFHYLNGTFERKEEEKRGCPIHSYSFRMPLSHPDLYEYAWVNRIFLFLRRWAAHEQKKYENDLFPQLRPAKFILTHDIDYVSKTIPLILKKTVFDILKVVRFFLKFQCLKAFEIMIKSIQFAVTPHHYDFFAEIIRLEKERGYTSIFNFYGGKEKRKQSWLLDPSYDISTLENTLNLIQSSDCEIGLHPSYHAWRDVSMFDEQKASLQILVQKPITSIRQHWLRFSWADTWKAQENAGFTLDTTLMWNDRPGFRNGSALQFVPLDNNGQKLSINVLPTAIMDSQFFDYTNDDENASFTRLKHYLDEVYFVGGEIAIVWHHRVFHPETGWKNLYEKMLDYIKVTK